MFDRPRKIANMPIWNGDVNVGHQIKEHSPIRSEIGISDTRASLKP